MREHPIPQDVTGYRFHIIGNMTLKQFMEVAAGVVVAVVLYNTNLAAVIKWPLMLLAGGLGALIAWVPFEERSLDYWLTVFFTVLYRPTKFFWKKQAKIPAPFLFKPRPNQVDSSEVMDFTPARKARVQEYLTSVEPSLPKDDWETSEDTRIANILQAFDTVEVKVRDLPALETVQPAATTPVVEVETIQIEPEIMEAAPLPQLDPPVQTAVEPMLTEAINPPVIDEPMMVVPSPSIVQATMPPAVPSEAVITNTSLPFPTQPTIPNKLVGMVLDSEGKIVTNAIIEIKNLHGLVARAVKTNALGQFFITTPLENGSYIIAADKAGLEFDTQSLNLTGQIVAPIQITARPAFQEVAAPLA